MIHEKVTRKKAKRRPILCDFLKFTPAVRTHSTLPRQTDTLSSPFFDVSPVQQASSKSVNIPSSLTPRWTRDQASSEVYSELKGIPPKIRMSSLTPQHTTHLTLTHRTLTLPSFTMQARCSAHWNNQTLTDQKKKKKHQQSTYAVRFKNAANKTFFTLLLCVLRFTTCGPSPSSPIRIRTCARNSKQHQNEGDAQPIVGKRGSTNDLTLFHPQRS